MESTSLLKQNNQRLRLYPELMEFRHPPGGQHRNTEELDHLYGRIRRRDTEIRRRRNLWWHLVQQLEPAIRRRWFQRSVILVRWVVEGLTFRGLLPERIGRWRLLDCLLDLSE
jgi:hypothetical protein